MLHRSSGRQCINLGEFLGRTFKIVLIQVCTRRNHVPWDFLATSMGASIIIVMILRTMLAKENARRDGRQTPQEDVYNDVYLSDKDGLVSDWKVDKVYLRRPILYLVVD